jgi:murein DD-endopeptidase MepM/ murein hydrolase activator NlpD
MMLLGIPLLAACIPSGAQQEPSRGLPPPRVDQWERQSEDVRTLPAPPPAWKAQPVEPDGRMVASTNYTVESGDTLRAISEKTGAGSEAIARANGIEAPYVIRPGQRLIVPGGRYHLVRAGQTGIAIARAYGVDWSRVVTVNALEEPYILRVGQRVIIPDTGTMSVADRAAAFRVDIDDIVTGSEPAIASNERPASPTTSSARVLPSTAAVAQPARLKTSFLWPVHGDVIRRFGAGASGERNDGIKISTPLDTPILAAADGVVAYVGSEVIAMGGLIIVKHGDGWSTVYGHAGQLLVQRGQSVKRGQMIGLSGDSGNAQRPQLHFEIRQGRMPVDPLTRLPKS